MGILSDFLGGGLGQKIADIVGNRIEDKGKAQLAQLELEKVIGDRAHEVEMALIAQESTIAAAQSEVNKVEAASDSLFKSGWRPMAGWACVGGLVYQVIVRPLLAWLSAIYSWMPPPSLEMDTLLTLLFGMLGLGAYRSYERVNGKA